MILDETPMKESVYLYEKLLHFVKLPACRTWKGDEIGAFLLQIVLFLTDFAEFRVKLVFCIQAENIISSKYPLLRDDQKSSLKWVSYMQFSVLYTSGNHYFIHFWWLWIVSQQWGFLKVHENSPKLTKKCNSWDFSSKQYCAEPHFFCNILGKNEKKVKTAKIP